MSLINQMLRDLETRNAGNNTASTLQHTVSVSQTPVSKMPLLIASLLLITVTVGAYWAYQYSQAPMDSSPAVLVDNVSKNPLPITPFEKVLAAPNAITAPAPQPEQAMPEIATVPAVQTVTMTEPKLQPEVQTAPAITAAPDRKSPNVPKSPLGNQITLKQQADKLFRQAESTIDGYSTVHLLEQILKLDPRHLKARLLLAKTLYSQGQVIRTAEFLDQSLSLFPDNLQFINTRAQLFLKQKNPNAALNTLQQGEVTNSSNETYLALLAASYQQLDSFANAAKVYQKLVTINPEKAENWLGLALAQEKLGNIKLAHDAYQQALNKNTLKESIVSYIKLRLTELR